VLLAGAQTPAEKCEGLPPGKHANLERMAASFGLSCEQQLKIEVMLHAEESVSKPLLRFSSFTSDDQQGIMLKLKLAARRQIRTLLTPDQQKQMDQEIDQVAKAGKKGGKGGAAKESAPRANPLEEEGTLSQAVMNYAAFSPAEKKEIVLQVKRAARNDTNLALTPDQQKKLDTEILELSR
ncbi:MAG TPA: hypothetical protein VGV35_02430, partial [Bryobacteraceae bacterium]|nr:hypothetical protein [Bryobacteraceae bacterium]